jgi:methyl-accepting chemotaxis protein
MFSRSLALGTIRQRLLAGSGVLVLLMAFTGLSGRASLSNMSTVIGDAFTSLQKESVLSSRLAASATQELTLASAYLDSRDTTLQSEFRRAGWDAHDAQRAMNRIAGQTAEEIALVASIEARLSSIETHFVLAHRLADLGRRDAAVAEAGRARALLAPLLADVQNLTTAKARKVTSASTELRRAAELRGTVLIASVAVAVLIGVLIVLTTVRWISRPLAVLMQHAREISAGNLGARTTEELPSEFRDLADAMNASAESLSRVVSVAMSTADDVASSAHDLAEVSEQISRSASQMASSMTEITSGAEGQVRQLRGIDDALRSIREGASGVLSGASEVNSLAGSIEESARSKRAEIERAMAILDDVRTTVHHATSEVVELNRTAEQITKFVASVSRIAEQTDLLALNAAIEAARAGQAGRGFAVVADEVRRLAEQARTAADDVVQLTNAVTSRVAQTMRVMEVGAARVGEIERVSRDIDGALRAIGDAAGRTREAAASVTVTAEQNVSVVASAASGLASIARTAEGHAAEAQEVSASTEEQSAACEQMSSASSQLLAGSTQLREIVGGLKTRAA